MLRDGKQRIEKQKGWKLLKSSGMNRIFFTNLKSDFVNESIEDKDTTSKIEVGERRV